MMTKEYIERKTAIKMIEEDLPEVVHYRKEDAIECLECLPSADVVDVVRCKDCKYSFIGRDDKLKCDILYPSLSWVDNYGYCSYGERRVEE